MGVERPVVLVGGSFGGRVTYTNAGPHPKDVAGVVLLDPTLQDEPALERAHLTKDMWLPDDAWRDSAEKIDVAGTYAVAQRALATTPTIPGTLFVTKELWAPDGKNAEPFRQGVRAQQAALADHYDPRKTITVDAPHAMLAVVPDHVAAETLAILDSARH